MTQYKLLILKTSCQFPGMAWLHHDIAFHKDAAASGLVDWSCMNLDSYNFHTLATVLQTSPSSDVPSSSSRMLASSSNICQSWNDGTCLLRAATATAAKNVKVSTSVSTVPFRPHSPKVSTRGQLLCHRVNTNGISVVARSFQPTLQKTSVQNVDIPGLVSFQTLCFPFRLMLLC